MIARNVHLIEVTPRLRADAVLIEKAAASKKVNICTDTHVVEIVGDKVVTGIRPKRDGEERLLPVRGVFVEIGSVPNSHTVDFVEKNRWGGDNGEL